MSEWIPTTEQVRDCFSTDPEGEYRDPINAPSNKRWAEKAFDRWLADHDERVKAEAKAEALREVSSALSDAFFVDLWWTSCENVWAVPDRVMIVYARDVIAAAIRAAAEKGEQ